ncbi:probable ATP-dependent RNA helicase DDX60 [Bombina bombina]|uniref:probable ATP-dependent RNA helicase DDX60 n=1 Tax=Bombina bombina TaxID=8345 RepID=UPI00235AB010|nr:probable ATP-dependent RNA helicase DDX60 [Bombina bombina]
MFIMKQLSYAQFSSLLNDYVESEFFLIDGDSLLISCISDETLQKGQDLHFIFLVERYLQNLTTKGGNYVIVFFTEAEYLYFDQPDILMMRAQLILHLKVNTHTSIHTEYSNFESAQWNVFLKDNCPHFLLVSDEGLSPPQTYFLHLFILNTLGSKVNVVLTSGQENDVLRVYGFHVNSYEGHQRFKNVHAKKIKKVCHALLASYKGTYEDALLLLLKHLSAENLQKEVLNMKLKIARFMTRESDIREVVCVASCSMALRAYASLNNQQSNQNPRNQQKHFHGLSTLDHTDVSVTHVDTITRDPIDFEHNCDTVTLQQLQIESMGNSGGRNMGPKFKEKSKFYPIQNRGSVIETFYNRVEKDLLQLKANQPPSKFNLSLAEKSALASLKEDNSLVIKNSDKGGMVVVMDRQQYIDEGHRQLCNENNYLVLQRDPTTHFRSKLAHLLDDGLEQGFVDQGDKTPDANKEMAEINTMKPSMQDSFVDSTPLTKADLHLLVSKQDITNSFDKLWEKLDSMHTFMTTSLNDIKQEIKDLGSRVETLEENRDNLVEDVEMTVQQVSEQQQVVTDLLDKIEDMENRSRRSNIRLKGIPESITAAELPSYLHQLFCAITGVDQSTEIEIERAHRALRPKPKADNPPRDVIVAFLRFPEKDKILKEAAKQPTFKFQGNVVHFYQDLSTRTLQRRGTLRPLTSLLRKHGIQYRWGYPFALHISKDNKILTIRDVNGISDICEALDLETPNLPEKSQMEETLTAQQAKLKSQKSQWTRAPRRRQKNNSLYNGKKVSKSEQTSCLLNRFLEEATLPQIDQQDLATLNSDISASEVERVIQDLKPGMKEIRGEINKEYTFLWTTVLKLAELDENIVLQSTSNTFLKNDSKLHEKKVNPSPGLIEVRSDIVKDFAGDVLKDLPFLSREDPRMRLFTRRKSYDELIHWHSGKPLSDDYDRTMSNFAEIKDEYALRDYQKLHAYYCFYGQSLEGNISKTIVVQKDKPTNSAASWIPGTSEKKKTNHVSKKDLIKEENQKRLSAQKQEKEINQWKVISSSIHEKIRRNLSSGIKRQEEFIAACQNDFVKITSEMEMIEACFSLWTENCTAKEKGNRDFNIVVELMRKIQCTLKNYQKVLSPEDQKRIARFLRHIGFQNLSLLIDPYQDSKCKQKGTYSLDIGAARFQLQYMGHYLTRNERHDPDPRVQHFIPDTWQRELLDVVDNNESAVIVAPTSSGKTYASYYCMEKVLKEGNDGVVVYVSPTKALVNQVVATVYNRFNKHLPKGLALCGVFTRDYRTDALNSQILVTVPQCLEILLLAPHRQKWVNRIKYVIFDEVHCLGGEIGAEVWEHLLVMIRCPFLALSATISNPEHLAEWLQSVKSQWECSDKLLQQDGRSKAAKKGEKGKEEKSYNVRLVIYNERYNDLEKYVCSARDSDITFDHYHPCAALTLDLSKKYGIPADLAFSPRESVQLYDAMANVWPEWPNKEVPDRCWCISHTLEAVPALQPDPQRPEQRSGMLLGAAAYGIYYPVNWMSELSSFFSIWLLLGAPGFGVDNAVQAVPQLPPQMSHSISHEVPCGSSQPPSGGVYLWILLHKYHLLCLQLYQHFRFLVRGNPSKLILKVDTMAEKREDVCNEQTSKLSASSEKKVKELKKQMSKQTQPEIKKTQSLNPSEDLLVSEASHEEIIQKLEKMTEIPPDCTYANNTAVDKETLLKAFHRVRFLRDHLELKSLATRGIGYHHASVHSKGRQLVEMLFRMGFLTVITATGSLALGINMPCKSVVFMHDSVYLDALSYRQMSGRAGRRGQDLIGNVFFYGIPMPKVRRLIKANIPQLKGQFPLSISFILRIMLLAAKADDKEDAKAKALSLLKHSFMSFNQPLTKKMLKLYFLFSLHFLVQEKLLDHDGNPIGFTGLITHLHYHEPSNFVFVSFLEKGLFRKLLQSSGSTRFSKTTMENLVLVLANIFGRRYLLPFMSKLKGTFSQSKVFLETLPQDFADALHDYNQKIRTTFAHCLLTVGKQADMKKEYELPLSKISFDGTECNDSELVNHLMNCSESRSAISPFACLSGNTDHDFFHTDDPDNLLLQKVKINTKNIPILRLEKKDALGRKMPLNAYIHDFFKHGSLAAMANDNMIHEGEAYQLLRDFLLTIKSISVSLEEMCKEKNSLVVAFQNLCYQFQDKLKSSERK